MEKTSFAIKIISILTKLKEKKMAKKGLIMRIVLYGKEPNLVTFYFDKRIVENISCINFGHPQDRIIEQPGYVKSLFKIEGIKNIYLTQYDLTITKADIFDWPEIIKPAKTILQNDFGERWNETICIETLINEKSKEFYIYDLNSFDGKLLDFMKSLESNQ
jgi:hypothetical protein